MIGSVPLDRIGILALSCCCGMLAGCLPANPVPDVVTAATQRMADFLPTDQDLLTDRRAGAVMDDLSALDGCWAWTSEDLFFLSVYELNAASATYSWWRVQDGKVVAFESGSFEVASENRISFTPTRIGTLNPIIGWEESDVDPFPLEAVVSLADDELLIDREPEPVQLDENSLLHKRFPCP